MANAEALQIKLQKSMCNSKSRIVNIGTFSVYNLHVYASMRKIRLQNVKISGK